MEVESTVTTVTNIIVKAVHGTPWGWITGVIKETGEAGALRSPLASKSRTHGEYFGVITSYVGASITHNKIGGLTSYERVPSHYGRNTG